jgi:uncharacterized membrane protein YedE/YeeE
MILRWLWAGASGALFGFGLVLSEMIDPRRVQGFLDMAAWDPTLVIVMASAVSTTFIGYRLVLKRSCPVADDRFRVPSVRRIDRRLVVGAAVFGIGWGLAGFCPGPALAATALGFTGPMIVLSGMVAGSLLFDVYQRMAGRGG